MAKQEVTDISVYVRMDEPAKRAIAVWDGTTYDKSGARPREKWTWLPRSQIEVDPQPDGTAVITMPVWLAEDKGLV